MKENKTKDVMFVKPIMTVDKFFKVADLCIQSKNYEMEQLGRAMRNAYSNQIIETEVREQPVGTGNPEECKSGVCD